MWTRFQLAKYVIKVEGKVFYGQEIKRRIQFYCLSMGSVINYVSNITEMGTYQIAVDHSLRRKMASETVDPIPWMVAWARWFCLLCFRLQGRFPADAAPTFLYCGRGAQGGGWRGGGLVTPSQLDLLSLTPTNHIYYINIKLTWVSHIFMDSGISISVPYQRDVVRWYGFSYGKIIFIWCWFFVYQLFMNMKDG